ncbi:uncharacterized protein LOC117928550 isoform X1 [Vitis riparia]|uniref:uncharacterized protein LOC117928550 isoform X1 n=2 Tax=Vitis riparia TaxID=96939 RepID=UPI00155AF5E9|nr:uncharacterized protein LOC117928550 isoform X1 [Vitis riparia]XP_034704327.1 uncharacterized protein LOC117928550 isoform X1 [Vitis riparia]XP_034704328.1 uncharacterized protein LOC117928550 isoform X1 [Vitis riparia]XP_034704329.1 uncharacterized protein LOC117928550 isoform X1 [Vitis riparia]
MLERRNSRSIEVLLQVYFEEPKNIKLYVLPFGSMPLKTYLPDGDIDLTALCPENDEEDFARDVCTLLEGERQMGSEFRVEDISYIRAKVKIVKCMVQDISVDISFNQTGGLSTLCFLEQIDIIIGKDHLFKRSVILIKAWCYYEGRILGSHCGLLSTYALEILVLYVINLFYSSLYCPLAVLYRFLDYYSTFDWEKFGVSVLGPVSISSLLTGAPEAAETADKPLLINEEFLWSCVEAFAVSIRASECTKQPFLVKHINIQDPLRDYNNLGRSISLGNSYRFRYAISVGAQRLKEILMLPEGRMNEGLKEFFNNTLDRNGGGQGADEGDLVPFGPGSSKFCSLQGDYYGCLSNLHYGQFYHANLSSFSLHPGSLDVPFQWMYFNQSYVPWGYTNHFASMLPSQNTFQFYSPSFQFEEQESNMNAYVPSLPFCYETASQLSGLAYHFEEKVPQGTGTFIPNMAQIFHNDLNRWERGQDPEHEPRSGMPQTRWAVKRNPVSMASSVLLEPEQEDGKNSEPTLQVLSPKPEDEGGMVSKSKNQAPSLKPEQERQSNRESKAQDLVLKRESESDEGSQEAKAPGLVLKPEPETGKNRDVSTQGLLLKPEVEQRKSLTPESTPQGPSAKTPPANYDHSEVPPEMNQAREAVNSGCLHPLEEFPELPHKLKQDSSLDPKDGKKELVPDQPYSLADPNDFPPLGSKQKGKGKSQRKK